MLLLSTVTSMASCGIPSNKNDEGTIKDVEIAEEKSEYDEKNIFHKLEIPFGYRTKNFNSGIAHLKMEIPSSYSVNVENARHIIIQAPSDDKNVGDATFHLIHSPSHANQNLSSGAAMPGQDAHAYVDYFKHELPRFFYSVNGVNYTLREQEIPDEAISGYEFANKDTSKVFSTQADNVVTLLVATNDAGTNEFSQLTYYFDWDGVPSAISTLIPKDKVENARKVIEFIISSSKYLVSKYDNTNTYKLANCTLSLPNSMVVDKRSNNNIARIPVTVTDNATAGITIGSFTIDLNKTEKLTKETMDEKFGMELAGKLSPDWELVPFTTNTEKAESNLSLSGRNTDHYFNTVTYNSKYVANKLGEFTYGSSPFNGTFYGDSSITVMQVLTTVDNDKQYVLAILCTPTQFKEANKILQDAANSISFK